MIKEYYDFLKDYLKLAEIKTKYLIINILSAFFYKAFDLLLPLIASLIIKFLTLGNVEMSYFSLALFAIIYLLSDIAYYINYRVYGFNVAYCYDKLTDKIMNKLLNVDSNFTRFIGKGRLINSINSDVISIGDMNDRISEVLSGVIQILTVLVIVSIFNIWLALVFIVFTFSYILFRNYYDRKINFYHNKVVVDDDKYSNLLAQIISGLQEIKTFNILEKLRNKLKIIQRKFNKDYGIKRKYFMRRDNDVEFVVYLFRFLLYLLSLILIFRGKMDISGLVLIIAYHENLVSYISDLISSTCAIRETNTSVCRINDILNYSSEEISFGNIDINEIYGAIEFKNVSLNIRNNQILKDINLKVKHNEVLAIVGEAGSGKTMLFNLLLRLYKPSKGEIFLDNINIFDYTKDVYTKNVSVANQKPFIFNLSIKENLNFIDTNIKNQVDACKLAGIHDFIATLPKGYNTILRENGSNISGGQKQMISIARTILSDAEVLLLDDITTSLDPDTAKLVPSLIKKLKKERTIIMITKKPDLMKEADRIVVLDHGRIKDIGTHKELLERSQIYQMLQSRKSPSKIGVFDNA